MIEYLLLPVFFVAIFGLGYLSAYLYEKVDPYDYGIFLSR